MECILGCGAGGAIYLVLLTIGVFWVQSSLVVIFLVWPAFMILGFLAGTILGTFASLLVLSVNASLGWPLKSLWFSFVVGGLSGFLPFFVLLLGSNSPQPEELIFMAAIGPLPHMVLGHLCAYWLTEKAVRDHNQRFGVVKYEVVQTGLRGSRFGITHIMILTAWAALGFAAISFASSEFRTLFAQFYLALQCAAGLMAMMIIQLFAFVGRYRKRTFSQTNH